MRVALAINRVGPDPQKNLDAILRLLLFPIARCFSDHSIDQQRWDATELPEHAARVKIAGIPTLMVNYIADVELPGDGSFGGAFTISAQGKVITSKPLGLEGYLMVDIDNPSNDTVEAVQ